MKWGGKQTACLRIFRVGLFGRCNRLNTFEIIADCPDFLVINKSVGVAVHKDQEESGLVMQVSNHVGYPLFLIHRLDKVTSGLLLLAKTSDAAAALGKLFEQRHVQKYYLALSDKKPAKKQGMVKGGMSKARRGAWKLTKSQENLAITRFFSQSIAPGIRAFIIKPLSGKTHQIRVALKSLSAPILGDELYGGSHSDRVYLHAWQLRFELGGISYQFEAPLTQGDLFRTPELQQQLESWTDAESLPWSG